MASIKRATRLLTAFAAASATLGVAATSAAASLEERLGPHAEVERQAETGTVGFIGARPGTAIDSGAPADAPAAAAARRFVLDNAGAFGLARAAAGLRVSRTHPALANARTVRLQQTVSGVPVLGGELAVNVDPNNDILSVIGETTRTPAVSPKPRVGERQAAAAARAAIAKARGVAAGELTAMDPRLRVYDPDLLGAPDPLRAARLAWVLEVSATDPPLRELVVVDAQRGVVALHFDQLTHALNRRVCDADDQPIAVPCTTDLAVRAEGGPPVSDDFDDVNLAYEYSGDTYDFFFGRFGRDSLDGAGMPLISTVDFCPNQDACPYENAFWNGAQMVYGNGFASADDVVGHELSHGVTDFSSHLFYYAQSGAINESMSDVFGEFIDLTNGRGTDDAAHRWLMGEDLPVGEIRDLSDPPAFGDPDRMGSPMYSADPNERDAGGVHTNSGVGNKTAYLIADGDSFNGQTVAGIGIDKAALIFYEANSSMLVSGSDYADLANALRQACANLAAAAVGGIATADCSQVAKAVVATEMDESPANAPATEAPTAAETCTPGEARTLFADDLEDPTSGRWAKTTANPPPFGGHAWFYPQIPNVYAFDATYATSGTTNFWGDDPGDGTFGGPLDPDVTDSSIRMTSPVTLPPRAYLRFRHAFGFEDAPGGGATTAYDGGVVEFSTDGGASWSDLGPKLDFNGYGGVIWPDGPNPLAGRQAFVRESNGYVSSRANLDSLAGRKVLLRFRLGADDGGGDYGWFVDDIEIFACSPPPSPPPPPPPPDGPAPDARKPRARIDSGPRKVTTKRRATFRFSADEPDATFECSLRGKHVKRKLRAWRACTSPRTFSRLRPGKHVFRLRPTDAAGNVGDVVRYRWKLKRRR